jgi:hypothetical protein
MDYDDRYNTYEDNVIQKNGDTINNVKKLDRGYNEIHRRVLQSNGMRKNKKIIMYNSGDVGSHIRNAVTGIYTKDIVGSASEDSYFTTSFATGECPKGPLILYFDSPEQYERHFYTTLSENIKSKWNDKRQMCM